MSLQVLCPTAYMIDAKTWQHLANQPLLSPMHNNQVAAEDILRFTQALSKHLMTNPASKAFPELVALGYWLRKHNIEQCLASLATGVYKPLGLVVHYAPNNVDTQFVYSWVCALLMGNRNIVRLGSQTSSLQQALLDALNSVLTDQEFKHIAQQNLFCRYDRQSVIGQQVSQAADARVMWGGDDSVNSIRQLPTKPRCRDISFADRYSACVIDGDALTTEDINDVADGLRRDTDAFLQQACSSPRVLFWLGNAQHQEALLTRLGQLIITPAQQRRNEQLVYSQYLHATGMASSIHQYDNLSVIKLRGNACTLSEPLTYHPGYQTLLLCSLGQIADMASLLESKCQTLSYWGIEKSALIKFLAAPSIQGVDRAVQVGQALNFSPIWDGYELLSQLSRQILVN